MDSLNPDHPPLIETPRRVWKFWGTALWGLLIFVAMFVGQIGAIVLLVVLRGLPMDLASLQSIGHEPQALALSVIMGLPATLAAVWLAIRIKKASFTDYLALYWPSWKQLLFGAVGLVLIVLAWEVVSRSLGREATPGFMTDLLKSGRDKGAALMLLIAFSVAAPMSEEVLARGFLFRGWSASFCAHQARSSCRRWCGRSSTCNTTCTSSPRSSPSACGSATCAIARARSGSRSYCTR